MLLLVLAVLTLSAFTSYIVAAALLAFLLYPVHQRLSGAIGARLSAFLLVVSATVAAAIPLAAIVGVVVTNATEVSDELDQRPLLAAVDRLLTALGISVDLPAAVRELQSQLLTTLVGEASDLFGVAAKLLIGVSLAVFLLYYLLVDGARFVTWVRELSLLRPDVQDELYANAQTITWAVLKGHILVSVFQGLAGGIGLYVAGVPNAAFWTIAMVLLAFVPVIGVAAVWIPASVYLFLADQTGSALFLFVYGSTVVSWIDNYLRAFLVDRESGLHAGIVLAGVLGGIYFWGALGLFIGPIILGLFKAALIVYVDVYGSSRAVGSAAVEPSDSEVERRHDQAALASFPDDR